MLARFDDLFKKFELKLLLMLKFKDVEIYNRFMRSVEENEKSK